MVRATMGATLSQSVSLALTLPREDSSPLEFTRGSVGTQGATESDRAVVRRRFAK